MLKKLSSNILIYGLTNGIKSLVPFLMLPILTMYLSINDYGILSIIEITILFLVPIISLNISGAINVEYFQIERSQLNQYITNAFMLSLFAFILMFTFFIIFNNAISSVLNIDNTLVLWLPIFALFRVSTQVLLGIYQVSQQPKKFALFTILQTVFDFALSYVLVINFQYGYIGRLEGVYIAFFIFSLTALYLLFKMGFLSGPTMNYSKEILKFGLPLIPHAISGIVMAMSDRYFISHYIGNEDVGLYTVAYQLSALMLLVSISVNQAWTPILYSLLKSKDKMQQIIVYTLGLALFFIIVGSLIYFLKNILFNLLVDHKFHQAKEFFSWLLLGFVFQSLYFLVTNFLFFEKKTALLAKITISGAILNIILNYFLIQEFGTIGVAYATAITWIIYCIAVVLTNILHYNRKEE